jgi:hypothetical protein
MTNSSKNRSLVTRFLSVNDVPELLRLESLQWDDVQAADAASLRSRLTAHPELCVGTFCETTGEALASLFLKPIAPEHITRIRRWTDCVEPDLSPCAANSTRSLFGISLTSVDKHAINVLGAFFWPHALSQGWHEVYLGSPMPGLRQALHQETMLSAGSYAHAKRGSVPRDVQLRYYHQKGLLDIVAVLPDYFPHEASLNYGVLLRGDLQQVADRACAAVKMFPYVEACAIDDVAAEDTAVEKALTAAANTEHSQQRWVSAGVSLVAAPAVSNGVSPLPNNNALCERIS